jgi:phosphatidylglycerol lysyltransferase
MSTPPSLSRQLRVHRGFAVQFLSMVVGLHGLYILAVTLLEQIAAHHGSRLSDIVIDLPLLIGLSLLYLSTLLRRQKRTAWLVTVMAYTFYLGLGAAQLLDKLDLDGQRMAISGHELIRALLLPVVVLSLLVAFQREFVVKSDIQGFRFAARFAIIILCVALLYGVTGFLLLDKSDFHQEISPLSAVHYTVDQFDLTTQRPLHAYTKRAHLFTDSLSFVSCGALIYAAISLFQPLRVRLSAQNTERERAVELLRRYGGSSEEFFKLWPHDKQYFFDDSGESVLAFHVNRGVALCLSDPVGNPDRYASLLANFRNLCFHNDWLPALVHVAGEQRALYEQQGYSLQKLGEEAILDLRHFQTDLAGTKYFRQIRNKFTKQGFSCELLRPPHHPAVLERLQAISQEWLDQGGRTERGFVMGYYTDEYMQLCDVMVARDAAGTIQAFVNLVPADFDKQEATYDLLRQSKGSLGNINDFILVNLIDELAKRDYQRLNLGLCPLVGLDDTTADPSEELTNNVTDEATESAATDPNNTEPKRTVDHATSKSGEAEPDTERKNLIDSVLQFAYANGDRFYSFSGLHRFKAKYEPEWHDRYFAYQGGVRGFSRTMTSLMRAMRVKIK